MARQPGPRLHDLLNLRRLGNELLQREFGNDQCKGSILLIRNGVLLPPECAALDRDVHSFGLAISLVQAATQTPFSAGAVLDCASGELPFQDAVFNAVILYMCMADGSENELGEACRVLIPGGELVVLGPNRMSWSGIKTLRRAPVPAMNMTRLRRALDARDMVVKSVRGMGLLGRSGPVLDGNLLSGLALPFADVVLLSARHRGRPQLSRLDMKEFPAGALPTALEIS